MLYEGHFLPSELKVTQRSQRGFGATQSSQRFIDHFPSVRLCDFSVISLWNSVFLLGSSLSGLGNVACYPPFYHRLPIPGHRRPRAGAFQKWGALADSSRALQACGQWTASAVHFHRMQQVDEGRPLAPSNPPSLFPPPPVSKRGRKQRRGLAPKKPEFTRPVLGDESTMIFCPQIETHPRANPFQTHIILSARPRTSHTEEPMPARWAEDARPQRPPRPQPSLERLRRKRPGPPRRLREWKRCGREYR